MFFAVSHFMQIFLFGITVRFGGISSIDNYYVRRETAKNTMFSTKTRRKKYEARVVAHRRRM